ncbi:unnamed protein product, partial [Medioppia subpectinata]
MIVAKGVNIGYESRNLFQFVPQIHCSLKLYEKKDSNGSSVLRINNVTISNWETYLEKLFKIQWVDIEKKRSPFVKFDDNGEEVALKFSDLPLRTKVDIIHCLCDYRLYSDDISQLVNDISGDEYRVEPLGTDSKEQKWSSRNRHFLRKSERKRRRNETECYRKPDLSPSLSAWFQTVCHSISERQEAWSLFCKTEEDWKELCLNEIFENQEKERQKVERQKLLELLPRRLSSRIELKKIQKERDDLEEQEISRQKQELNERKSHETERQRSERIKHDRQQRAEKRLQLVEERAERALKRQAMEYEMFADSQQTDQNMETNESNESQFQYIHEEFIDIPVVPTNPKHLLYDGLEKVICNVKSNRDAWPFLEPVDGTKFPMYYQVIEEPIDLSAIEKRIEDREYETFEEVENDFKLMVNNCETFNGPKNGYTLMAYGVWRAFKKASLKHLERELSYDESNAFIYPQKWTKNNTKPAIEAKKKKIRNKKSSTFTALNVLAEAAEKAVEANESRLIKTTADTACVDTTSHSNSHLCDTNSKSAVTGGDTESKSLQIHGDMWANFLFNKNHTIDRSVTSEESDTSATNASTHENLTFKSLDEWTLPPLTPQPRKALTAFQFERNNFSNRDAWPFLEPVDGTKFPMYYQVIEEPIDLSAIEKRIEDREYETFEEVENDLKLMVNNCETFNGPKNGYTLMAYGVWRAFKKASLKHLEREL